MDHFISKNGQQLKQKVETLCKSIMPEVPKYYQETDFPMHVIEKIRQTGINGLDIKGFGSPGLSIMETGALFYEFARWDVSLATFMIVQNCLGMQVVNRCGSDEQRQRFLPDQVAFKKLICFGLTEPTHGSDATGLLTTARKTEGGYLLTGKKRWIGNATFADYIIVWARNVDEGNKIQAFIVEKGSRGLTTSKIENKYSIRMVINADINMEDVFVPANNRLEKALDFASGANEILKHSRIYIAWVATGCAAGALEAAFRYTLERKQFGKKLAGFPIIQEKLQRSLADVQSMIAMCHRVSEMYQQGNASMGQIAMTKAYCSRVARAVTRVAREVCGGNGILIEQHVMKQMLDLEGVFTYEGTYEINALVAAREITGISAVK